MASRTSVKKFVIIVALLAASTSSQTAWGAVVRVTTTAKGADAVEAYVALVAPDGSWNAPAAEALTKNGAAELHVPPGRYELIAAASAWGADVVTVFASDNNPQSANLELVPHGTATGLLETEEGLPMAAARIAWARAAIIPEAGVLSARAMRHLGRAESTQSDDNGWWSLAVPSDRTMPLLIEAAGYAPAWLVNRPTDEQTTHRIVLRRGSQLEVRTKADSDVLVTLVPTEAEQVVPDDWQRAVWTRSLEGGRAIWESLQPGTYRIEAYSADPLRFYPVTDIGTVTLATGEHRVLDVEIVPADEPRVEYIAFRLPRRLEHPQIEAFARTAGGSVQRARHSVRRTIEGTLVHVDTNVAPSETYLLSQTHVITAGAAGGSPSAGRATELLRAEASFRVTVPEGVAAPAGGTAEFRNCMRQRVVSIPFNVERSGAVVVPWPTECSSAVFGFSGYAPVAIAASLRPSESKQFGAFKLTAAASATIRVVRRPGLTPAGRATVRVSSLREPADVVFGERMAGEDGRVLFDGLPAGEELSVEASDADSELSGSVTVTLVPAVVTAVDVEIPLPGSLIVTPRFESAFLDEFPEARVVAIHIRRSVEGEPVKTHKRDIKGDPEVSFESIAPGVWNVIAGGRTTAR